MKRMSTPFYLASWLAGMIGSFLLLGIGAVVVEALPVEPIPQGIAASVLGFGAVIYAIVVWLVFTYRIWSRLPAEHARTTPGKALGFLFIPFFNLYWLFQAYWGWAKDYNTLVEKEGLELRPMPAGLALAMCIMDFVNIPLSFIPVLNVLSQVAVIVLTAVFIIKACGRINALCELPAEALEGAETTPHRAAQIAAQLAAQVEAGERHPPAADGIERSEPGAHPAEPPHTSLAATWGFALSLLGAFWWIFAAIPGLVLGIVGLTKIRRSSGRLKGQGLAIAAIVISGFYLLVIFATLLSALSRARMEVRKATDRANLRRIGLALSMYKSVHEERYPPGLYALLEEGYIDLPEVLVSPGDPDPPRIGPQGYPCSYEYPGPLPLGMSPGTVVVYTRRGVFPGGRSVLFLDGGVRFVSESGIARGRTGRVSLQDSYNWLMERREQWPEDADHDRIADFYGMSRP